MSKTNRPKDCPLFLHRNGQWAKKVRGKLRYFGTDLDAAMKRWANEKDHLLAGYDPPRIDGKPTLAELANLYLANSQERVATGEVRADHTHENKIVLEMVITAVGGRSKPDSMSPQQWAKVRTALATRLDGNPVAQATLQARLSRAGAFLNWSLKKGWVKSLDLGGELDPPAKRLLRREATARGKRLWDRDDLLAVIEAAGVNFRPVLLLGINCAMGGLDIANLTRSQVPAKTEFLDCPRNKTGVERRVWLWPETRAAIAAAVAKRPEPQRQKYENRLLLSARGYPWSRVGTTGTIDLAASSLTKLKAKAGITNGQFYDLRRTFRTIASETCDLEAINLCMGHEGRGEGSTYLQGVSDERIRRVCESVRSWLYGVEVAT